MLLCSFLVHGGTAQGLVQIPLLNLRLCVFGSHTLLRWPQKDCKGWRKSLPTTQWLARIMFFPVHPHTRVDVWSAWQLW